MKTIPKALLNDVAAFIDQRGGAYGFRAKDVSSRGCAIEIELAETIKKQAHDISALVAKVGEISLSDDLRQQMDLLDEMEDMALDGPVGSIAAFSVAGGYAYYLITGDEGGYYSVMHIPAGDAWRVAGEVDGRIFKDAVDANLGWWRLIRDKPKRAKRPPAAAGV